MANNMGNGQSNAGQIVSAGNTISPGVSGSITTRLERAGINIENIIVSNVRSRDRTARAQRSRRHRRTKRIRTEAELRVLLATLESLEHGLPQVVIDCEGFHSRNNGFTIMEIFVLPLDTLYLIDVDRLRIGGGNNGRGGRNSRGGRSSRGGRDSRGGSNRRGDNPFTIELPNSGFCLKTLLESETRKKIMWDLRLDVRLLGLWYQVRPRGILDCQHWEVGSRIKRGIAGHTPRRLTVNTALEKYLRDDIGNIALQSLQAAKAARTDNREAHQWVHDPMSNILLDYTADVKYMGLLWYDLNEDLKDHPHIIQAIKNETDLDLRLACREAMPRPEQAQNNNGYPRNFTYLLSSLQTAVPQDGGSRPVPIQPPTAQPPQQVISDYWQDFINQPTTQIPGPAAQGQGGRGRGGRGRGSQIPAIPVEDDEFTTIRTQRGSGRGGW